MFYELTQKLKKNWRIIAVVAITITASIVVILFLTAKNFQELSVARTTLDQQKNFTHLHDSDLFAYNGLAFYKVNIETGREEVLNSGLRLPEPTEILWANSRGALINFMGPLYLTAVEDSLTSIGQEVSQQSEEYTWYLDFSSNKLSLVSKTRIDENKVVYSEEKNGFYYVTLSENLSDNDSQATALSLRFYNTRTKSIEVLKNNLGLTGVASVKLCSGLVVCLVARDDQASLEQTLYGFNSSGKRSELLQSDGLILPTSKDDVYIELDLKERNQLEGVEHEGLGSPSGPAKLYDTKTKFRIDLGFDMRGEAFAATIDDNGNFFIFDDQLSEDQAAMQSVVSYRSGIIDFQKKKASSKFYKLTVFEENKGSETIITREGYANNNTILMDTTEKDILLSSQKIGLPSSSPDSEKIVQTTRRCHPEPNNNVEYYSDTKTIEVFFTDSNTANQIETFSNCMTQSSLSNYHDYYFQYKIRSSVNGRIVG